MPQRPKQNVRVNKTGWIKTVVKGTRQLQTLVEALSELVFAFVMLFAFVMKATDWLKWLASH